MRELIATLTRPQLQFPPLPIHKVIGEAQYFESHFLVAEDSSQVTTELYKLLTAVTAGGKQVHDANIAATMLVYGIPRILTHNVADFARFAGYINVIPLA